VVTLLLLLVPVVLPVVNGQSYSTVTSVSTVTTVISNSQTNSYAVGTTSATSTSQNVIYNGSFSISVPQGFYCGEFEYVPFQATAGEEIEGTLSSTKEVSFYILTANDYVVDGLNSGTGGRCNVPSYQLTIGNTQSKAFNFTAPTTGKYYFIVFLFSYSNGLTADVTLNAYSANVQTFPFAIYSSTTTALVATFTQTVSSYYTQQAQALAGGDNLILIIAALVVVVIAIAAAYLLSHRKKATRNVTEEPEEMICKKCGSKLLPKAKFCKKCGTPT
jgi:ribosomal protein L40E